MDDNPSAASRTQRLATMPVAGVVFVFTFIQAVPASGGGAPRSTSTSRPPR
jgi:hypothetical protein